MRAFACFSICLASWGAQAQTVPAPPAERHIGVVKTIDFGTGGILLAMDNGGQKLILPNRDVAVLRVAPGETDLAKAVKIGLVEIGAGDRLLVRGTAAQNGVLAASSIVVMSRGDLARKQEAESAEWKSKGIAGKVVAVNPESGQIVVSLPQGSQSGQLTVKLAANASQFRYRQGSARFADALPASLAEIKAGDLIQAVGERSQDVFTARRIVTGYFRNFAATVVSVDAAGRRLVVKTLDGKNQVAVMVSATANVRRLSPEAANLLIPKASGGGRGGDDDDDGPPRNGGAARTGNGEAAGVHTILEKMPQAELGAFKRGDAVIVACGDPAGAAKVTAITLIGGVERLLEEPAGAQQELLGSWELNLDPGQTTEN